MKTKKSTASKTSAGARVTSVPKTAEELQKVRTKVKNLILDGSVEMTQRVVQSVTESGTMTSLKFLWEMAGLFPTAGAEDDDEVPDGSFAKTLLERLGLPSDLPRPREEEDD